MGLRKRKSGYNVDGDDMSGWIGSSVVRSTGPLLVEVNDVAIMQTRAQMVCNYPDVFDDEEDVAQKMSTTHWLYQEYKDLLLANGWRQPQ